MKDEEIMRESAKDGTGNKDGVCDSGQRRFIPLRIPYPTLVILLLLIAGILLTGWTVQQADRAMREDLLQQASLVAQTLNIAHIKALNGTETDLDSADYQYLKQQFANARQTNKKCRFIYLMGR